MVKRTKAETEKLYRGLLAEHAKSGLSLREFADQRGIPAGTLSCWRHLLKEREAERKKTAKVTEPRFVPVEVRGATSAPPQPVKSGVYEIVLGRDRLLRLPADFDD